MDINLLDRILMIVGSALGLNFEIRRYWPKENLWFWLIKTIFRLYTVSLFSFTSLMKIRIIVLSLEIKSPITDKISEVGVILARYLMFVFIHSLFFFNSKNMSELLKRLLEMQNTGEMELLHNSNKRSTKKGCMHFTQPFPFAYLIIVFAWTYQILISVSIHFYHDHFDHLGLRKNSTILLKSEFLFLPWSDLAADLIQITTISYTLLLLTHLLDLRFKNIESFCLKLHDLLLSSHKFHSIFHINTYYNALEIMSSAAEDVRNLCSELDSITGPISLGLIPISIIATVMLSYKGLNGSQNEFQSPILPSSFYYGVSMFSGIIAIVVCGHTLKTQASIIKIRK
jgi:hypothetical protein